MCMERIVRLVAGIFVMGSLALGYWVSPYFYLFTAFVGLNLFQSSLTRWCLLEEILRRFGVHPCAPGGARQS
ncbi:MAG: DUF2892 domain-containing protein [Acidobacteria bacterium]|nr:DUF2892 domain-containing protein [Acidobacteriota bacterium]